MDSEHDLPHNLDHPDHTQTSSDQSSTSDTRSTQTDDDHPRAHDNVGAHIPKRANPEIYNSQLGEKLAVLAADINAAHYQFLKVLAEFDNRARWNCGRARSCARSLNWRCGISMGDTVRRLSCDCSVVAMLTKDQFPMKRRQVSWLSQLIYGSQPHLPTRYLAWITENTSASTRLWRTPVAQCTNRSVGYHISGHPLEEPPPHYRSKSG